MAAEALKKSAAAMGHEIRIETQGSVGAKNKLTDEEIARADAVIVAADAYVDTARFAGKRLYQTSTKAAFTTGERRSKRPWRCRRRKLGSRSRRSSRSAPRAPAPTST